MIVDALTPINPGAPPLPAGHPVIVFDGHCVMCSAGAQFVLRHDGGGRFRLTTAQSETGRALYRRFGFRPDDLSTMLVVDGDQAAIRSDAVLQIAEAMGWPWRAARALKVLPVGWRDRLYEFVARNRLRWFGGRETCWRPDPDQAGRIL